MITFGQIKQKVGAFQINNSIVINGIYFKIPIFFYKTNITCCICHLINIIIYVFVLHFFFKVYIIVKNKKALFIHSFIKLLENNITISLERLANNFTNY